MTIHQQPNTEATEATYRGRVLAIANFVVLEDYWCNCVHRYGQAYWKDPAGPYGLCAVTVMD